MNIEGLITIEQAALALGTTRRAVEVAMQRGHLPYVDVLGRRAIRASDLEIYRAEHPRGRPRKPEKILEKVS